MSKGSATAVCIVVENLPVPLDRRVWREACALRDAGYRVSVICPRGQVPSWSAYENREGIEIYRHRLYEASSAVGYLLEYGLAILAECYLMLKVFAKTRFRILQGCNPPDTVFLLGLLLRPFGVQYIFDHHDLSPELLESKFDKAHGLFHGFISLLEVFTFKTAKVCIATNESFKEIAIKRGGKRPEEVFVVRNCPDLQSVRRLAPSDEVRGGKAFVVAYVGFMGSQDGLTLLIESIEHIVKREKRDDVGFVLVGGGSEVTKLKALVAARGLELAVTFTGQVPHESIATYLSSADLGVAPDPKTAMNDKSTMIKILEYMAYELPVVLFDLKEGRRIAGNAALYATPNDPIDFANQILTLLNSERLRRELGAYGRKRIEEHLNWQTEKAALLEAYATALEKEAAVRSRNAGPGVSEVR